MHDEDCFVFSTDVNIYCKSIHGDDILLYSVYRTHANVVATIYFTEYSNYCYFPEDNP